VNAKAMTDLVKMNGQLVSGATRLRRGQYETRFLFISTGSGDQPTHINYSLT
jgi:hypothetical protein